MKINNKKKQCSRHFSTISIGFGRKEASSICKYRITKLLLDMTALLEDRLLIKY